jgi:hypothetical protein
MDPKNSRVSQTRMVRIDAPEVRRSESSGRVPTRRVTGALGLQYARSAAGEAEDSGWSSKDCNALRQGGTVFSSALKKILLHRVDRAQARIS